MLSLYEHHIELLNERCEAQPIPLWVKKQKQNKKTSFQLFFFFFAHSIMFVQIQLWNVCWRNNLLTNEAVTMEASNADLEVTAKDEWRFKGPSLYLMICGASRRMREVSISNRSKEVMLAYKQTGFFMKETTKQSIYRKLMFEHVKNGIDCGSNT